jgi:hypothetical protein
MGGTQLLGRERQAKFERDKAQFEREWAEKQRTMEER